MACAQPDLHLRHADTLGVRRGRFDEAAVALLIRDRYEPLAVVGQGGEAQVVKGFDHQLERVVAMKIRPVPEGARRDEVLGARILVDVPPNPHLPLVREDFFDDGRYVVVMDWVEGTDLSVLLKSEGRPGLAPSNVLRWMADAASALTHLHTSRRRWSTAMSSRRT